MPIYPMAQYRGGASSFVDKNTIKTKLHVSAYISPNARRTMESGGFQNPATSPQINFLFTRV